MEKLPVSRNRNDVRRSQKQFDPGGGTNNLMKIVSQQRSELEPDPTRNRELVLPVELYMTSVCPHCVAARQDLEWRGIEFREYDVERDSEARARMLQITGGLRTVPVIVEEGKPVQVGWMGRGCIV